MTINLTREDFEQAIKSGASVFEGNTILDTGKPSGRYYRFIRVPLVNGEHKVDALYGQDFCGVRENKPLTFNEEMRFLCLVVDDAKIVNETYVFKTIFCRYPYTSDSVVEEMARKLFDVFRKNVTEDDKNEVLKNDYYNKTARENAFSRVIRGYKEYNNPIDSVCDEMRKESCFGLTPASADELVVDYLANPTGWAERMMEKIKKANSGRPGRLYGITLAVVEELTEEYMRKYNSPNTQEIMFRLLVELAEKYKTVRFVLNINGKTTEVKYPVKGMMDSDILYGGGFSTWNITPRSEENRIEEFIANNDSKLEDKCRIPIKYIPEVYYGNKLIWKNPDFANS